MAVSTIPKNLAADVSELNSKLTGYFAEAFNTSVPVNTDTQVYEKTLPSAGLWLVTSYAALNKSGNGVYNHCLSVGDANKTVRAQVTNGGGSSVTSIINVTNNRTVHVTIYTPVEANAYGNVNAIKLY